MWLEDFSHHAAYGQTLGRTYCLNPWTVEDRTWNHSAPGLDRSLHARHSSADWLLIWFQIYAIRPASPTHMCRSESELLTTDKELHIQTYNDLNKTYFLKLWTISYFSINWEFGLAIARMLPVTLQTTNHHNNFLAVTKTIIIFVHYYILICTQIN